MSKQEFILSFDCNQKKRYEEFLFEYRNYSIINEYQFIYQRDGVYLDVEYFKDLVSLSKKAARSSLSCSYLPVFRNENFEVHNDIVRITMQKQIHLYAINNFTQKTKSHTNIFETVFLAYPTFKHYLSIFTETLFTRLLSNNNDHSRNLSIIESYFYRHDLYMSIYNNISLKDNDQFALNIIKHVPLKHYRIRPYVNLFDVLFLHRDNFLFINDKLFLEENTKHTFIQNGIFVSSQYKNANIYNMLFTQRNELNITTFNALWLKSYDYYSINTFSYISGLFNPLNTDINNTVLAEPTNNYTLNAFENDNANKTITGYLTTFQYDITQKELQYMYANHIDALHKNLTSHSSTYNSFISFQTNNKAANYVNATLMALKYNQYLQTHDSNDFAQNINKQLFMYDNYTDINKNTNAILSVYQILSFIKTNKVSNIYDAPVFTEVRHKYLFTLDEQFSINKYYHLMTTYDALSSVYKKYQNLELSNSLSSFKVIYRSLDMFSDIYSSMKISYSMVIHNNISFIQKTKKDLQKLLKTYFFEKTSKNMYINQKNSFFTKINRNIEYIYSVAFFDKLPRNIFHQQTNFDISKVSSNARRLFDSIFTEKLFKNLFIDDTTKHIFKEYKDIMFNEDYISDLFKEYYNFSNQQSVISINKVNKPMFTADITNHILKKAQRTFIPNTDSFLPKLRKLLGIQDNLICDKLMRDINFISLLNIMIIKKRIQISFINTDIFIDKYTRGILTHQITFIEKIRNQILIGQDLYIYKLSQDIVAQSNIFINKRPKVSKKEELSVVPIARIKPALDLFSQEWINTMRYAFMHQDISTLRTIQEIYSDNTKEWLYKSLAFDLFKDESVTIDRYAQMYQTLNVLRVNNFPTTFYDQYFLSKEILTSKLPALDEIHKIASDLSLNTDSNIDWAWVWEEDEGFDDPFKIDELLLPENDSRYEDFENIIFNRETLKPRAPIQIIDDYTFIAKFPNHYPIKDDDGENAYKDIALEYLDVRTSIMRKVFIGYYKVWQDHIFEFAQMTIPQSAKKILDYLYVWILMSFAEEDIPEALRVFRQVRWYLERGIIECSEYYITYEPGLLTSGKLDTTDIGIPNDLLPPDPSIVQNNTMYVDTNRHVIANDPARLKQEAHITFYIDNHKDVTISFSLHTFTPVYIILNKNTDTEDILEVITLPTTGKMVYNIPYTGDVNTFTIEKLGADNNDNDFFIGNIVITDMGHDGELTINFNPKIQGNKVLNHVSQKVIAYMNLYNDNEELMRHLVSGNAHLSEVYEHLLEYWDLHWQNKDKGKRLTIKRT